MTICTFTYARTLSQIVDYWLIGDIPVGIMVLKYILVFRDRHLPLKSPSHSLLLPNWALEIICVID